MYTLAYLHLWLGVNDRARVESQVVRAVRKELRRRLALDRQIGGAGDATQQEIAECYGSWTVALLGYMNHLRKLGDIAGLEAYRERVAELVAEPDLLDVDLRTIRLPARHRAALAGRAGASLVAATFTDPGERRGVR